MGWFRATIIEIPQQTAKLRVSLVFTMKGSNRSRFMRRHVRDRFSSSAFAAVLLVVLSIRFASAAEPPTLELLQTIPLKGAAGRLDHLAIDNKGARLFIANLSNNSLGGAGSLSA
jgi:hypothetical protein